MSRALDKGVEEALKKGNHEKVYRDISGVLLQRLPQLLEIELLGQSHVVDADTTFLQDENAIAIPKLRLVQAFLFARKLLMGNIQGKHSSSEDVLKATAVMLLMDPEHLTAANTRRRILSSIIHDGVGVKESLLREKYLIDSFLTSRLHRHTKSPILWGYRQWLLDRSKEAGITTNTLQDMRQVVFIAAERHPRNYYAWLHARYLISNIPTVSEGQSPLPTMTDDTKKWCFAHHNDISGWAFLAVLLGRCPELRAPVVRETMKLAESFHWRNEAVWYFMRNMVLAMEGEEIEEELRAGGERLGAGEEGTWGRTVVDRALRWVEVEGSKNE